MIAEYPELRAFSAPMVVVGHGRARRSAQYEALIDVIFAPAQWWRRASTEPDEPTSVAVEIGIGHLPHFPVGRVFEPDKEPKDEVFTYPDGRDHDTITVLGAAQEWPRIKFGTSAARWFEQTKLWGPPYPSTLIDNGPLFEMKLEQQGHKIFVSPIEVVRAVFGLDSDMLRLVVEGGIHKWATNPERLIDIDACRRDPADPSTVFIKAHRQISPMEVRFAVRVAADRRMKTSFRQVFARLQNNKWMHNPSFIETINPFERASTWHCAWRWMAVRDGQAIRKRRLVTRIHAVQYDLGVENVVVSYPTFQDVVDEGVSPRKYAFDAPRGQAVRITAVSGGPSSRFIAPIERKEGIADFADPWTIIMVGVPEEDHRRLSMLPRELDELIEYGSTGSSGRTRKATAKMRTTTNVPPEDHSRAPHPHILRTAAALENAASAKGWSFEWVKPSSGPGSDAADGLHRYPDTYKAAEDQEEVLPWSRLRSGLQRRALVCRLKIDNRVVFVIDAEHEIVATDGRLHQDGNSRIGILVLSPGDDYYRRDIDQILRSQSFHRGVWRKSLFAGYLDTQVHEETWFADPARYALKLRERLRGAVTGASRS